MSFVPPPLITLVLAVLLLGVMARAGLLIPTGLVGDHRTGLENASGAVVLLSLFAASAQLFTCLTPDAGILRLVFNLFFLFLLWNTLAAAPDRARLLHSLFVIFGSAFLLKYVALASLYDPQGGMMRRVVTALLEGVALGTLQYAPFAPATGYAAFFTVLVYLGALTLLPRPARAALVPGRRAWAGRGGARGPRRGRPPMILLAAAWVVPVAGRRSPTAAWPSKARVSWVGRPAMPGEPGGPVHLGPGRAPARPRQRALPPGAVPPGGRWDAAAGFVPWVESLVARAGGPTRSRRARPPGRAIRQLESTGTVAVGDVSNALAHLDLLAESH